jgi:hypothetical protein
VSQTNTPVPPAVVPPAPKTSNGLATAAMVLGIIGVVLAIVPLLGVVGAVTGGVGLALAVPALILARQRNVGTGKAVTGLVLGIASIMVFVLVTGATVAAVDSAVKGAEKEVAAQQDKSASSDTSAAGELKDIELGRPERDPFLGATVEVTVTNGSSKTSDYFGDVVFESPNGKTQYGTGPLAVDNLKPGQTRTTEVVMLEDLPKDAGRVAVRVTDFDRIQSL